LIVPLVLGFVLGFVGSMPLVGPVALLVVSRAVDREFGAAVRIGIGGAVGEAIYALVAWFGFSTFLARHPIVFPISNGVAAITLFALGVAFAQFRIDPRKTAEAREREHARALQTGFSATALNPTLLATWSVASATLHSTHWIPPKAWTALPLALGVALGIASWFSLLVAAVRRWGERFEQKTLTWIVRAMGVALIGIGVLFGVKLVQMITGARPWKP
jgi:threonine/homoserine/homoserine lactone efflux protein